MSKSIYNPAAVLISGGLLLDLLLFHWQYDWSIHSVNSLL